MMARPAIGIDIGGTATKVVLVDASAATLARVAAVAAELGHAAPYPPRIGVAAPGNVDRAELVMLYVPVLGSEWAGTAVRDHLPASALLNDVQAMTLAEWRLGAARGAATALCVALGTGVGGGLVIDGRLHLGVDDTAGAIGHSTVEPCGTPCYCGNVGCLERYASGAAIALGAGTSDAADAAAAAIGGSRPATEAFERAAFYLAVAIANACALVTPDVVVIGGGVAAAGDLVMTPLRAELERRTRVVSMRATRLRLAELGDGAGAVGAALAAADAPNPTPEDR